MTNKEKCFEHIDKAFKILDIDGSGTISRCEDASFLKYMGATDEYALKYSTTWTLPYARLSCNRM